MGSPSPRRRAGSAAAAHHRPRTDRMARYRIAIRFGDARQQYHVTDVEATSLREALRRTMDAVTDEVDRTADLAEVRLAVDPDARPPDAG